MRPVKVEALRENSEGLGVIKLVWILPQTVDAAAKQIFDKEFDLWVWLNGRWATNSWRRSRVGSIGA